MSTAEEIEAQVDALLSHVPETLEWATPEEAQSLKKILGNFKKRLEIEKKTVNEIIRQLNNDFQARRVAVGKGIMVGLAAVAFGRRRVSQFTAVERESIRREQFNAVEPLRRLKVRIDDEVARLDRFRTQIELGSSGRISTRRPNTAQRFLVAGLRPTRFAPLLAMLLCGASAAYFGLVKIPIGAIGPQQAIGPEMAQSGQAVTPPAVAAPLVLVPGENARITAGGASMTVAADNNGSASQPAADQLSSETDVTRASIDSVGGGAQRLARIRETPIDTAASSDRGAVAATVKEPANHDYVDRKPASQRLWTSKSGGYHVLATLLEATAIEARLKTDAGREINVPVSKLSDEDFSYLSSVNVDAGNRELSGKVVRIIDGDTIVIVDDNKQQHKIRLADIDAPESGQAFGTKAREAIARKLLEKNVRVDWREFDKYNRTLGTVYLDDRNINNEMGVTRRSRLQGVEG